ncbi:MAG: hypothetical protein AAF639_18865 [Chloroflexota bacterium]
MVISPLNLGDEGVINTEDSVRVSLVRNFALGSDIWQGFYDGFDPGGIYQVVIYATDQDGLNAQPRTFMIDTAQPIQEE